MDAAVLYLHILQVNTILFIPGFRLHPASDYLDRIEGESCDTSARSQGIPFTRQAVNQIAPHKANQTDGSIVSRPYLILFSGRQIHHIQSGGAVNIIPFLPRDPRPVGADGEILLRQAVRHDHILLSGQIHTVYSVIKVEVKRMIVAQITQPADILAKTSVILIHRKIEPFGQGIVRALIAVECHAGRTFMVSPPHIAVNQKIDTAFLAD